MLESVGGGAAIAVCGGGLAAAADSPTAKTRDAFEQNRRLGRGVNVLGDDPIWQDRSKR